MFWFLLIIFLGIVIVGIATTEPPEKKVPYDPKTEDSKFTLIVNKTFEDEICRKIAIQTYQEKILDIIQEDLEYIYGKGWKEIFLRRWGLPYVIGTTFNSVENIVLMLLLSKSGFIPSCYRYQKISISNFDTANAYECLKIIHCIQKNIQNKRNDETFKIIFLPEVLFKRDEKRRLLELPQYDYPCSGGFYFAFQSVYMNSTYKIKDIHDQRLIQACKQASIGERNQEMINHSKFCVVYYDESYLPPRRKNSRRDIFDYQPKSGTAVAYDYAVKKKKEIINILK